MVRARLRPSRLLTTMFVLVHASAAAVLCTVVLPLEVTLAIGVAIAASLLHALWRHALLRSRGSLVTVEIRNRSEAAVKRKDGEWHDAEILGTSSVTPWLTVLNLAGPGRRRRHVLLVPDNIDSQDFRELRVLLRWARPRKTEKVTDA
jgi:toxin CptA